MHGLVKGVGGAVLLAASGIVALAADPPSAPSAVITATGYASAVCTIGPWTKLSGAGSFSSGTSAVVTYSDSDLVDAESRSIAGPAATVSVTANVLCNTALTWHLTTANGALRLTSGAAVPPGFSNQWLYSLIFGPYSSGGARVGSFEDMPASNGAPFDGDVHGMSLVNSLNVARFGLTFAPLAQSSRMLAGPYSEVLTVTFTPTF